MVTEFILIGFSSFPDLQIPLFVVFTIMYFTILTGNIIIITTVRHESSLHIPMYFFLAILSSSEICYTLIIIPNMLANLLREKGTISFVGCATQMSMFLGFGCTNCMLLTVMGYDRYVSIYGKRKAFSTCASHLIVVVVHFGCASIIYLRPQSRYTLNEDTLISVTYTLVTPLLNPVVYSLRNKDVQVALRKFLGRRAYGG
ncbi:olfactory receptor 10R2-like [Heteronotia binoei]|uniref:olfactory receptor 10R2-like n=1 Tax=Heteronotia binoei TaxID=13085 RepID=UPI00292CD09B|nr:olfactory receptor 10R2-like [Heteronotia binoei]